MITIDISDGHVAAAVFSRSRTGRLMLKQFAVEYHHAMTTSGLWDSFTALALTLVTEKLGIHGAAVHSIPNRFALTKVIRTPAVAAAKRARVIEFEAAQAIPHPLADVVWDHLVLSDDGRDLEVMLTAGKHSVIDSICNTADASGTAIARVVTSARALVDLFLAERGLGREPMLVIDLGVESATLLIVGPHQVRVRTLNLKASKEPGDSPKGAAAASLEILRPRHPDLDQLQKEVGRFLAQTAREEAFSPPTMICLTGVGSLSPGLHALFSEKFGLPVTSYDPTVHFKISKKVRSDEIHASSFLLAPLVGMALSEAAWTPRETGLLPPAMRRELLRRERRLLKAGSVALLAVTLLPPLLHYRALATVTDARTTEVEARLRPMQASAKDNAANLERLKNLQEQIDALQRLDEAKSNWAEFLGDLQDRLGGVEDVWLDHLGLTRGSASPPRGGAKSAKAQQLLAISGRLLDTVNPTAKVSPESHEKVKRLFASIAHSPFVAAIQDERFDNSQPGVLHFDVMLVMDSEHPL